MSAPAITLKLATSLDGRIATARGESQWITGPEARVEVHRLRAAHDAVVIGIGTALADDPMLTARTDPAPAGQPARVVFDSAARLSPACALARSTDAGAVIVIAGADAPKERVEALGARGVSVHRLDAPGRVDVGAALRALRETFALKSLFVEGGGALAASLMKADAVDRLEWFRAPIALGGDAVPAIAALELMSLSAAPCFQRLAVRALGRDVWETYERAASCSPAS